MEALFYLDDLQIDEPIGFDNIELSIKRDDKLHGMTFEAATSPLEFYGVAYEYLKTQDETYGVKANVTFKVMITCDTYDYEELLSGRLNFGQLKEKCGDTCTISIPWEQDSCEQILKARYDQKVDIDSAVGVDSITPLPNYASLAVETELTPHDIKVATEGSVSEDGDPISLDIFPPAATNDFTLRPTYSRQVFANINESELVPTVFAASDNGLNDSVISPVVLLDEVIDCFDGNFDYQVRLKGSYNFTYDGVGSDISVVRLVVAKGEYPGSLTILHSQDLTFSLNSAIGTFDYTYSGSTSIDQGKGFYVYFRMTGTNGAVSLLLGSVTFDKETYVNVQGVRSCPSTQAEVYLVHEALSRATEAVTNGCVRVKSSYYGRTDSEPFSFPEDGCGGVRSVTSGLKIRRAEDDKFFASVKDLVEGLNSIDNIGIAVEDDPIIPGKSLLRIEELDFFYRNSEVLRHNAIPKGDTDTEETKHYSKVAVGYKKWEVENVNGLDEVNANREFNTSIDTINSTLDITSNLVAGSYAIELTRQQSFATTGAADTKYDNEIFILCMVRSGYLYSQLVVDKGNITAPENIYSPNTIYNYRISPIRNLMRWYKTIAAGFAGLSNSINKLFFSSGTGNMDAKGMMTDSFCRMESVPLQENQDLFVTQFARSQDYTPLWKNKLFTYDYPMSLADYKTLKSDPYGYISSQCGDGEFKQYWIQEVKYKIAKGTATFILRRKY